MFPSRNNREPRLDQSNLVRSVTASRPGDRFGWVKYLLIAGIVAALAQKMLAMLGPVLLIGLIGSAAVALIYAIVSFRSLVVPFLVLIASVGCLRFVWSVRAPILPDIYLDRISLIWLALIFFSLSIYRRIPLRKPYTLDILIVVHALYIAGRVLATDPVQFHTWTMSVMTPAAVYFFAKNIIRTRKQMNMVLIVLACLSVYYTVTSIAEKFHIDALLFPRMMAEIHPRVPGRSTGPFRTPGIFGNAMGMMLPVFLYFIYQTRTRFYKLLFGLALVLGFVAVLFTYTRGSMLGAVVGISVVVFFNRKEYLKYVLPVFLLVPLAAFTVIGVQDDEFLSERLEATNPLESRAGNLVTALRLWRDYPLLGCGSFQFKDYAGAYVAPVELPIVGTIHVAQFRGSAGHDMYLSPLAEDGAIGALLQIMIHVLILRASFSKLKLRKENDFFAMHILPLFFGIYAIYFFGGLIISYRHFSILGSLYYMVAGITYGYTPEESESEEKKINAI